MPEGFATVFENKRIPSGSGRGLVLLADRKRALTASGCATRPFLCAARLKIGTRTMLADNSVGERPLKRDLIGQKNQSPA